MQMKKNQDNKVRGNQQYNNNNNDNYHSKKFDGGRGKKNFNDRGKPRGNFRGGRGRDRKDDHQNFKSGTDERGWKNPVSLDNIENMREEKSFWKNDGTGNESSQQGNKQIGNLLEVDKGGDEDIDY